MADTRSGKSAGKPSLEPGCSDTAAAASGSASYGTSDDMAALAVAELTGNTDRIPELEKKVGPVPRCDCGSMAVGRNRDGSLWCYRCGTTRYRPPEKGDGRMGTDQAETA